MEILRCILALDIARRSRKNYEEKFATSLEFWAKRGGVLSSETIAELQSNGYQSHSEGQNEL